MDSSFAPGLNEQMYHSFPEGKEPPLTILLAEKEAALAESEQKVIRQRVLYEKARDLSIIAR